MTTQERLEVLAIPKQSAEFILSALLYLIAVVATVVAVLNLFFQVAIIVSCIWLAFIAWTIYADCRYEGGFRNWLVKVLGFFARKHFVETMRQETGAVEIWFGYQLFGRRLFYFNVPLHKIETVEWSPGQNPKLWNVFIWFDHDDPDETEIRSKWSWKPAQDIYDVGISGRKKRAEAFGLTLVDFLSRAGATFVRGEAESVYVRATSEAKQDPERQDV